MSSMQLETSSRCALYLHVSTLEWLGAVCPCGVCRPNGTAGRIWTFPKTVHTWAHQPASNPLRGELQGASPKGISPCLSPAGWPVVANQKTILSEDLWPQQKIRTYVFGHFLLESELVSQYNFECLFPISLGRLKPQSIEQSITNSWFTIDVEKV